MDELFVQEIMIEGLKLCILVGAPILGSGMIVGLVVAILQATTSIQEQTLTFVPKILAIGISIIIFGPWIMSSMLEYTRDLFELIPQMALP